MPSDKWDVRVNRNTGALGRMRKSFASADVDARFGDFVGVINLCSIELRQRCVEELGRVQPRKQVWKKLARQMHRLDTNRYRIGQRNPPQPQNLLFRLKLQCRSHFRGRLRKLECQHL